MNRYKMRMLRDVDVVGAMHREGWLIGLDGLDRINEEKGIVEKCIGHGEYWEFKIGKDVVLIINEERRVGLKDRREK